MKAATYHGAGDIRVENVDDLKVEPDGVLIQVKVLIKP